MSIDINWNTITGGEEGRARAEAIRSFIHDRFQLVPLPRFIRSVQVHSFDFGSVAPAIEIKDISDPLPEFYADDDDENEENDGGGGSGGDEDGEDGDDGDDGDDDASGVEQREDGRQRRRRRQQQHGSHTDGQRKEDDYQQQQQQQQKPDRSGSHAPSQRPPACAATTPVVNRALLSPTDYLLSPSLLRTATAGMGGGGGGGGGSTFNINSYFHLPLSAGLSGATTSLAAVAGAQTPAQTWPDTSHGHSFTHTVEESSECSTSTSTSSEQTPRRAPPMDNTNDIQIVAQVQYAGDVKMCLTAELLLDYPMPSFVGIPLKLYLTGIRFQGAAILAHVRRKRRAHFCFLSPEDGDAVLQGTTSTTTTSSASTSTSYHHGPPPPPLPSSSSLLQSMRVESEIGGRGGGGQQALKNVGKVEHFVLEQVRRIFEDEFVYPSFWTFLV